MVLVILIPWFDSSIFFFFLTFNGCFIVAVHISDSVQAPSYITLVPNDGDRYYNASAWAPVQNECILLGAAVLTAHVDHALLLIRPPTYPCHPFSFPFFLCLRAIMQYARLILAL